MIDAEKILSGVIASEATINGSISGEKELSGTINCGVANSAVYDGDYSVTPSGEEQVLNTEGLQMNQNVVIKPIPSNYGLIEYDGSRIRIS